MKTYISFILAFAFLCFQTQETESYIKKIKEDKTIIKKESYKKTGWNGGYVQLTVYQKKNIPVLIEKQEKQVRHLYLTDGTERDKATLISAKFYIVDWDKEKYIRTGNIRYIGNPYKPNPDEERITEMKEDYKFEFDKNEIENLIKNEN